MGKLLNCVSGGPELRRSRTSSSYSEDEKIEKVLQMWRLPITPLSGIYQLKADLVDLLYLRKQKKKPVFKIEAKQKAVHVQDEHEEFPLLEKDTLGKYKLWKYNYIHIGLIQVAVKPLTRRALDCSMVVCVCDSLFLRFSDSPLGLAEFSLADGPVYFNVHPCRTFPLKDYKIFHLKVKTSGFSGGRHSQDIAVVYRVYYKLSTTPTVYPKEKVSFVGGSTTIVETNLLKDYVPVTRDISWDSIEVPAAWW